MITYSTNWMGPVSLDWYKKRGLLEEGSVEPTTHYSAGRIDIRDDTKYGYDGWHEYGLAPMHGEDWNDFSEWLDDFKSQELLEFNDLIAKYEEDRGRKIRWREDKVSCNEHGYCPNCGMDFDGGLIWETGMEMYGSEERADEYAEAYGATRTKGRWGKRIGIYDMDRDMTTQWKCPECAHEWPR